jgi:hypothetical protein
MEEDIPEAMALEAHVALMKLRNDDPTTEWRVGSCTTVWVLCVCDVVTDTARLEGLIRKHSDEPYGVKFCKASEAKKTYEELYGGIHAMGLLGDVIVVYDSGDRLTPAETDDVIWMITNGTSYGGNEQAIRFVNCVETAIGTGGTSYGDNKQTSPPVNRVETADGIGGGAPSGM